MSIGIPIKLLHEAEGHIITVETGIGEIYRGKLLEAEDNMNCQLQNVTVTARNGQVSQLEQVFIRGSMIRFLIVPDMLKNAPMFKPRSGAKGLAAGAGKSAMMRAQTGGRGDGGFRGRGGGFRGRGGPPRGGFRGRGGPPRGGGSFPRH